MIVDTHTHVIAHDEARYPLRPSGVGSQWYRESPCDANELADLMTAAGVDAAVLVQAFGAYTYDNSYTIDSAAASPDRFVSIAIVDAQDPATPETVSALAHETGFTGVRLFSIGALEHPQPTWLDHPITFELWEVCANLGLRVLVACLPEHLSRLQRVLAQFPDQLVVLDHAGFVPLDGGPPYPEAGALFDLVEHTNLHLKVTSHLLEASEVQGDAGEIVDRLVAEFGAHRLVWGSDYPQTHDRPYADLVALAEHACRNLSKHDRALVLGGTALELWPELGAVTEPGFDVFDVHHHVGRAFDALGGDLEAPSVDLEEVARIELADRLRIMDEGGVHQALVIPGHGYLRPNGIADTRRVNDEIAAYRDATPERFPVACGIVEPRDGADAFAEIDRAANELGLVALSFHTRFQGVSMDSQWILRYLARMGEVGLVPLMHAMDDTPEESLWKLASIARQLPDLTMIALDPFAGFEATRQCFFVAEVAPNIVFDTSLSYNFDFIEDFALRFGAARVVFGTDLYSYPVGRRISHLLPQIVESALSRDDKAAILGGNARRLLGVEELSPGA